jgi:pseudaminic acid synthase
VNNIEICGRKIGPDQPPFIIAEMSGNHNQSLGRALEIVEAAACSGAHALKLQTYTADTMTLDADQGASRISGSGSPWEGANLYQLYQEAHTPWEWHGPIFQRCRELGLIYLSTPFDDTSVDFLESLEVPCYKIASFENTDIPLIRKVASTGKPLIISTGLASVAELDESVRAAREAGCRDIVLLKCTSSYPAAPENSNIATIPHLRALFGAQVGLSDHTLGIGVAVAAVALGATVIEKHFTLSRQDGGVDSSFSLEPLELNALVVETERAWRSLGGNPIWTYPAGKVLPDFQAISVCKRRHAAGGGFFPGEPEAAASGTGARSRLSGHHSGEEGIPLHTLRHTSLMGLSLLKAGQSSCRGDISATHVIQLFSLCFSSSCPLSSPRLSSGRWARKLTASLWPPARFRPSAGCRLWIWGCRGL